MMHASGGIISGIGGLLVVFVGGGSLVLANRFPAFVAAVAALALLGEQLFTQLSGIAVTASYSAAGLLGGIIFAVSTATPRPMAR